MEDGDLKVAEHRPNKNRAYDFDRPNDLMVALRYAFALGVISKRDGYLRLTGREIKNNFRSHCKGIQYRHVNLAHLKAAFRAGWECVEMSEAALTIPTAKEQ